MMDHKVTMESDILVEIPPIDWIELRDLFLLNWPDNHVAWHTINNYVNWHRKQSYIKDLKVYSLNNSWRSDGTYVIADRYQLFIYSLEISNEKLKRALNLIDWSKGFLVSSFLRRHRSAVMDVISSKKLKVESDSLTFLYFLPKEEAKKKNLIAPDNVTLKPLSMENADFVNNEWPNKRSGSNFLIRRLVEWNPNIGAFDGNNELMGWCVCLQAGSLGALQVQKKFMRRGIGSLCVLTMSKILASMNLDTFALVNELNFNSQNVFVKLGFKHTDDAYWLQTLPVNGGKPEWSEEDTCN